MDTKLKVILIRFLRAFISGALATGVLATTQDITTWTSLFSALQVLTISIIIGGISGVLMAGDKLLRWEE